MNSTPNSINTLVCLNKSLLCKEKPVSDSKPSVLWRGGRGVIYPLLKEVFMAVNFAYLLERVTLGGIGYLNARTRHHA